MTLPVLDVETIFSSIIIMVKNDFEAQRIINDIFHIRNDMGDFIIGEVDSERAAVICYSLEAAASATELQSGSSYVTLSMPLNSNNILKRMELLIANSDS